MIRESLNNIKEGIQPFLSKPITKVYRLVSCSSVLIEFDDLSNKSMSFDEIMRLNPNLVDAIFLIDTEKPFPNINGETKRRFWFDIAHKCNYAHNLKSA